MFVMSKKYFVTLLLDFDTELKSIAESSDKKQTQMLSDGNMLTVSAGNVSVARVFFPANFHWH